MTNETHNAESVPPAGYDPVTFEYVGPCPKCGTDHGGSDGPETMGGHLACLHARGAPSANVVIVVNEPTTPRLAHPCELGQHRWAYLTSGGQACGYCGRPR